MLEENKFRIKIIFLGDAGVGKSSIIQRYCEDKFEENQYSTYNANYVEKEETISEQNVILELWDTAGQEEYHSLAKLFIKNSKIVILVYDITSLKSFKSLNYWYEYICKEMVNKIIYGILGNKTDKMLEEEVSQEKAKEFAKKIDASLRLVSAKEGGKAINKFIEELASKYFLVSDLDSNINRTIKLNNKKHSTGKNKNEGECCFGKSQKTMELKMVFLGSKGVGKTSIIKMLKGNDNINNLVHTKKAYEEKIEYNQHGQNIIVKIKDTNGDNLESENLEHFAQNYNAIFFVFNINKKNTLYNLEDSLNYLKTKKINFYLIGYNNIFSENINSDFDYENEAQKFVEKYGCEYEYISNNDIYKIKAIILENISKYLKAISKK